MITLKDNAGLFYFVAAIMLLCPWQGGVLIEIVCYDLV